MRRRVGSLDDQPAGLVCRVGDWEGADMTREVLITEWKNLHDNFSVYVSKFGGMELPFVGNDITLIKIAKRSGRRVKLGRGTVVSVDTKASRYTVTVDELFEVAR